MRSLHEELIDGPWDTAYRQSVLILKGRFQIILKSIRNPGISDLVDVIDDGVSDA